MTQDFQGKYHCGAIRFSYQVENTSKRIHCNCSICVRKGALMTTEVIGPEKN